MLLRIAFLSIILSTVQCSKFQKITGLEHASSDQSEGGEQGEKGFIARHEFEKGAKGHHDKENEQKHYAEENGNKKGYNHEDGYYSLNNQGQKGRKGYHYEDHGSYAKGHSTKGHHNIHKLNDFKKNTDFFDEDNDEGFEERHGGYEAKKGYNSGKYNSGGYNRNGYNADNYGLTGIKSKAAHYFGDIGHRKEQGNGEYYGSFGDFGSKNVKNEFKKYGYNRDKHQ